jgi:hypothetical protein
MKSCVLARVTLVDANPWLHPAARKSVILCGPNEGDALSRDCYFARSL